jgi:U4/U6.U5 tri-snRNP-associated protein 2
MCVTNNLFHLIITCRDYFLWPANYVNCKSELVVRFGEVVRKAWNPRAFKGQVSPHEFLQAIINKSQARFTGDTEADPVAFCTWLLNTMHLELTGGHRKKSSIITQCFQVR